MNIAPLQIIMSILIALWGVAMMLMGLAWGELLWLGFGVAVLIVGLPFTRNLLPDQ